MGALTIIGAIAALGGTPTWAWASATLVLGFLAVWQTWSATARGEPLPLHWLLAPATGFMLLGIWQLLAGATVAAGLTRTSLFELAGDGASFMVAIAAARSRRELQRAGTVLWAFSGLLGVEALLQFATSRFVIYWFRDASYSYPMGPFVNQDDFASCAVLLLPIAVAMIARPRARRARTDPNTLLLRCTPVFALLAAAILASARGAAIALALEAVLAAILVWRRRLLRLRPALLCATLLLAVAGVCMGPLRARLATLGAHDVDVITRWQADLACLRIAHDFPSTGAGLGAFEAVFPKYRLSDDGLFWQYAHDDYAQALAETGAAGAGLILIFLAIFLSRVLGPLYLRTQEEFEPISASAAIAACGFLLNGALDFPFHIPGLSLLFFFVLGLACAPRRPEHRATRQGAALVPGGPRRALALPADRQ